MRSFALALFASLLLAGCASFQKENPLPLVDHVDLSRFMGKWYVIAATPTIMDREAYNAVEKYSFEDGKVQITYTFNKNGYNGDLKAYNSTGTIKNPGVNSDWNVMFMWPFIADYKVIYLADDYSITVIGHPSRKYVWIMARQPYIEPAVYSDIILYVQSLGFDIGDIRLIPHE